MKKQRGEAMLSIMLIIAAATVYPYFKVPEARCWFGYLHNSMHGGQVIGKDGGGIPCVPIDDQKVAEEVSK